MKLFVFFILITMSANAIAQAKQLNELLKQYAYTLEWKKQQPIALQDTRELVIPGPINIDTLWIIKWKDIDSIKISDTRSGSVNVFLYGKIIKYRKAESTDTFTIKYFNRFYCKEFLTNQARIFLASKNENEKLAGSAKLRNKIRKAFHQLSNVPVMEDYGCFYKMPPVEYDRKTKALVYYFENSGRAILKASDFRKAEKITIGFSPPKPPVVYEPGTKEIIFYPYGSEEKLVLKVNDLRQAKGIAIGTAKIKVISFNLSIRRNGIDTTIANEGPVFNDEIIKQLSTIQTGTVLVFGNIRTENNLDNDSSNLSITLTAN